MALYFLQAYNYFPSFSNLYNLMLNEDDPLDFIYKSPMFVNQILKQNFTPPPYPPTTITEMLMEFFLHLSEFDFRRNQIAWFNGRPHIRPITYFDLGPRTSLVIRNPVTYRLTTRSVQDRNFLDKINHSARQAYQELVQTNFISFF